MLQLFQFVLDVVQPIDKPLKLIRHLAEQWRHLGILEMLEFGDAELPLLACLDEVEQSFHARPAQAILVKPLRKHAAEEKGIVADMLAHLAFAIERGRRAVYRVRFQKHLAEVAQPAPISATDLVQSFSFAEFSQKIGYIGLHFRTAHAYF